MISNEMSSVMDYHYVRDSITDLNSHANMMIVGKHAKLIADTRNKVDVIPFTPNYEALEKVLIVDAEVQYTCQYTEKV